MLDFELFVFAGDKAIQVGRQRFRLWEYSHGGLLWFYIFKERCYGLWIV